MFREVVKRTLRVPVPKSGAGDAFSKAVQLDSALLKSGFTLSPALFEAVSKLDPETAKSLSSNVVAAVKELLGDHVKHNVYFKRFPQGVPDTCEFWTQCIIDALGDREVAGKIRLQLSLGFINLLDLPKYGKYLHSYEDMAAVHDAFIGNTRRNVKVLQLGRSLNEELRSLYDSLAGSTIPLSESDRDLLFRLAEMFVNDEPPASIPIRENKALINSVRIRFDLPLFIDTPTDVLRLACQLSDGDVTLAEPTKFRSLLRAHRRIMLCTLNDLIQESPAKLSDVNVYRERWKRLCERLHPWEYPHYPKAQDVFKAAMGELKVQSIAGRVESYMSAGDVSSAINLLKSAPGMLYRSIDRLLRLSTPENMTSQVIEAVAQTAPDVPSRILFGIREHLQNRTKHSDSQRIFTNTKGRSWVADDCRQPLDYVLVNELQSVIDSELKARLPELPTVLIDPVMFGVAIPLTNKNAEKGFSIMPRGSFMPVCKRREHLRFFAYWREKELTTDYDLSVQYMDSNFITTEWASWTNLRGYGYAHSGDIVSAPDGASEFIDIDLWKVKADYVVPQVDIYSGERFSEVEESFFGFMERGLNEKGLPYEPSTVRFKSDMRGVGKVALPLAFARQNDGSWLAFWMQMYLRGYARFNRVETNRISAGLLARSILKRQYLRFDYAVDLMSDKSPKVLYHTEGQIPVNEPVLYIGLSIPKELPEGSTAYTLSNLHEYVALFDPVKKTEAALMHT